MKRNNSCYSRDQIAGVHIQTVITSCNIEKPQQKYRLETMSNRLQVHLDKFTRSKFLPCASAVIQNIWSA